jgi:hypothetical protein
MLNHARPQSPLADVRRRAFRTRREGFRAPPARIPAPHELARAPYAAPMNSADGGTWFELRPNGQPAIAVLNPKRYYSLADAEEAAAAMRERSPDYRFVEIIRYSIENGERSRATPVARV